MPSPSKVYNVITYVTLQVGIASNIRPPGDVLTGFLFKTLEPSFASTVIFSFYSVFILGLYFMAKVYEIKSIKTSTISSKKSKSKIQLLVGKDSNPMLAVASFLWVMFVLMSLFHLLAIGNDLFPVIT